MALSVEVVAVVVHLLQVVEGVGAVLFLGEEEVEAVMTLRVEAVAVEDLVYLVLLPRFLLRLSLCLSVEGQHSLLLVHLDLQLVFHY